MSKLRRLALAALLTAVLPLHAATIGGGGDPRKLDPSQKFDPAADPAAMAATYVATQAEGKLKGIKRVAITNMCVKFVYAKSASGEMRGGTRAYTNSARGALSESLDPDMLLAVANVWLERIEADFKAAGIELVPYETLAANDLYKKFSAKYEEGVRIGESEDHNNSKGKTTETVIYVSPQLRPFAPDCGTISPASTSTFVRMAYPLDAEFLTISGVVDLGTAKASGGLLRGASADIDFLQHIRAGDTQFQFIGKSGPGARVWLKQSVIPQQDPFRSTGKTTTERSGSSNVLGTTTTQTTETSTEVSFDQKLYFDNALQYLTAVHRMFLQKMLEKK